MSREDCGTVSHPLCVYTFFLFHLTNRSQFLPSVAEHETLFLQDAMDVVYTYGAVNAVEARTAVNKLRGITPPA